MTKSTTIAIWSSSVLGGALVLALQTPPETAASNAALWFEKLTGYLPNWPSWADAVGTALGVVLILLPMGMWLARRWRTVNFPSRHRHILQQMAAPLARAQELAMAYGPRNYAAFAQAKTEVEALNAQIPYDHGTHQAVKDLLHACEMLVHDAKEHWDERENRDIVHHISIGLFRFLHEGKPVDRGKIELPDWMREGESKKFMSARDEANLAARRREELEAGSSKEWNWRAANNEGSAKAERDTPLGEALAYATIGRWGCQFFDVVSGGSGDAASEKLRRFQQFAYDGSLRVWGKREIWSDLYQEIPREHWQQNQVEWFDLLRGRPRTEPRGPTGEVSYHDLMVSRAEIEGTMTFEGSQH